MPVVLLHFGGVGTYTAAFVIAVIFLLIFVLSFAFGPVPAGGKKLSREWLGAWLRASLPRLIIAAVFSGLLFLGSSLSGNSSTDGSDICGKWVAPLTSGPVTADRLEAAAEGLRRISQTAAAGDDAGLPVFFGSDTHNVTHDIDGPLRRADPDMARRLCLSIVALEGQFAGSRDLSVISREAAAAADALDEAAAVPGVTE